MSHQQQRRHGVPARGACDETIDVGDSDTDRSLVIEWTTPASILAPECRVIGVQVSAQSWHVLGADAGER